MTLCHYRFKCFFRPGMSSKVYTRGDSPTSEGADYAADSDLDNPAEHRDGNNIVLYTVI